MHDFSFKIFCLTVPKKFVENTSVYQKISGSEKFYASERGRGEGVSRFSVENFLSHSAESSSRGESFSVSLTSGIEKFYASEGYVTIFCRFFFVSQCRKIW